MAKKVKITEEDFKRIKTTTKDKKFIERVRTTIEKSKKKIYE